MVVVIVHILFLHETGRTSRRGARDRELKVRLYPYFVMKDGVNLVIFRGLLCYCCFMPLILGDCENWKEANLIRRPLHIQPEWYFLFAYAVLRSIPNKMGGVIALALSVFRV
jgi:ubiquinol-cytochrome c reductase cytochrome b subunit